MGREARRKKSTVEPRDDNGAALYHRVYAHEGFEESADTLLKLVRMAQEKKPGGKRYLFLDIDGHRNSAGGFDAEMERLQTEFVIGFLGPFLTEFPIIGGAIAKNPNQRDDIPTALPWAH